MSSPPNRRSALDLVAIAGLGAGAIFGIAGTMVPEAALRQVFWAIDGVGLVVATVLLAIRHLRQGADGVAAGFLVFALGETLLLAGNAGGLAASVPSFGGGVALWAAGLFLISTPQVYPAWVRTAGIAAAALFVVVALRIATGEQLLPTASPLPFFAYPVLVLTFVGWISAVVTWR